MSARHSPEQRACRSRTPGRHSLSGECAATPQAAHPERECLIVTEFLDGAIEISQAQVDDAIIDRGLAIIRGLWEVGLAHRDIKPANLLVATAGLPDRRVLP